MIQDNQKGLFNDSQIMYKSYLERYLLADQTYDLTNKFIKAILHESSKVALKLLDLYSKKAKSTRLINQEHITLPQSKVEKWKKILTVTTSISNMKKQLAIHFGKIISRKDFITQIVSQMMFYDKSAPLDLILYEDNHEEIRKYARKCIREMSLEQIKNRLQKWEEEIKKPNMIDALTPSELANASHQLIIYIDASNEWNSALNNCDRLLILSVRQLVLDLSEALTRCASLQTYLSTSLFLFWACDEILKYQSHEQFKIRFVGGLLLRNYIVTALVSILLESHDIYSAPIRSVD